MNAPRPRHPGFTLIEVVLAIVLLLALVGGLYSFTDGLAKHAEQADQRDHQMAAAEAILDELEGALATTYVCGRDGTPGIKGDGAHLSVRGRAWGFGDRASDVSGCELKLDGASISARRFVAGQPQPWEQLPAVAGLRVRYLVGAEWKTSFDSAAAGILPGAVEVSLWLGERPRDAAGTDSPPDAPSLRPPDRTRIIVIHDAPKAVGGAS